MVLPPLWPKKPQIEVTLYVQNLPPINTLGGTVNEGLRETVRDDLNERLCQFGIVKSITLSSAPSNLNKSFAFVTMLCTDREEVDKTIRTMNETKMNDYIIYMNEYKRRPIESVQDVILTEVTLEWLQAHERNTFLSELACVEPQIENEYYDEDGKLVIPFLVDLMRATYRPRICLDPVTGVMLIFLQQKSILLPPLDPRSHPRELQLPHEVTRNVVKFDMNHSNCLFSTFHGDLGLLQFDPLSTSKTAFRAVTCGASGAVCLNASNTRAIYAQASGNVESRLLSDLEEEPVHLFKICPDIKIKSLVCMSNLLFVARSDNCIDVYRENFSQGTTLTLATSLGEGQSGLRNHYDSRPIFPGHGCVWLIREMCLYKVTVKPIWERERMRWFLLASSQAGNCRPIQRLHGETCLLRIISDYVGIGNDDVNVTFCAKLSEDNFVTGKDGGSPNPRPLSIVGVHNNSVYRLVEQSFYEPKIIRRYKVQDAEEWTEQGEEGGCSENSAEDVLDEENVLALAKKETKKKKKKRLPRFSRESRQRRGRNV
mmetsp:Transcript_5782/g.10019  ORF Transcript_5782/g.10019 Transcript_5782/m.10019 type:complete len:542 (-) Transcript_5782:344-1969(-)|eukprot:CAMPEP_0197462394 /NCGR_PEP_ID=MMETSP1175-20131217/58997_1 /TAXON_ID=1003142 /ORGANISM="Triceratium dubium, Strain CCMP147" /LENGTH=541 /DNA_ID=CAMNT_0042997893 /DNA_START=19 /DNA_END=1644 /DNA_ORIENTATION=+